MDEPSAHTLERRIAAIERGLSLSDSVEQAQQLDDLERRIATLEAAVQSMRGLISEMTADGQPPSSKKGSDQWGESAADIEPTEDCRPSTEP